MLLFMFKECIRYRDEQELCDYEKYPYIHLIVSAYIRKCHCTTFLAHHTVFNQCFILLNILYIIFITCYYTVIYHVFDLYYTIGCPLHEACLTEAPICDLINGFVMCHRTFNEVGTLDSIYYYY